MLQTNSAQLGSKFYTPTQAQALSNPKLVVYSSEVLQLLQLKPAEVKTELFLQVFSGKQTLTGSESVAHIYAGHQLGKFNPLLGDGRALLLGEIETQQGHTDIYLKGSGKTPYSRHADGRASLSECLHEYQISEQLAALNIPTTRSLCVLQGSELVYRHSFEPAGILVRIAPSHIRFGSFEYHYFRRDYQALQELADFVMQHYYPECLLATQPYAALFQIVVERTAKLIAQWQAIGFVHGMMNTDNQSILGITLDLGLSTFNPSYDPKFKTNLTDEQGRYAFGQQPLMGLWNCNILARALSPLIEIKNLQQTLSDYELIFSNWYCNILN